MAQRNIQIIETKLGLPTLLVKHEGNMIPIHSKYNPVVEAERFIDSLTEEIEKSDHLLFYGAGLGYHIKVVQERYPEKVYSIYEPIEEVSNALIQNIAKTGVDINALAKHYIEPDVENIIPNIQDFSIYAAHRVLLITLPVYEKLVPNEIQLFMESYKKVMTMKVGNKQTEKSFNERWIINMMMNVKHTSETPNLLMQQNNIFEGKPVILVAAGPSLSDEIENLQYIKENGLAYIFAVGSASKALFKNKILPDAVLSYDPQASNWNVFEELMEANITDVPLIFGTTVAYETVSYYPGPKIHVVMSKDSLTSYLFDEEIARVTDSSTISNVTFQILQKLKVGKIILVGQNFAYRDDQFYAKGIKRQDILTREITDGKLNLIEQAKSFTVEDVEGGEVFTNITFNTMRKEMELYLANFDRIQVINTTKKGAKIHGTSFMYLSDLIKKELTSKVVDPKWTEKLQISYKKLNQDKIKKLRREYETFKQGFENTLKKFEQLKIECNSKNIEKINRILNKANKNLDKLHENLIYNLFFKQILNLHTEQIHSEVSLCNKIIDISLKVETMANIYLNYMNNILAVYEQLSAIFYTSFLLPNEFKDEMTFYDASSGVFRYEGNWEKCWVSRQANQLFAMKEYYNVFLKASSKYKEISFDFLGEKLILFGSYLRAKDIKIIIRSEGEILKIKTFNSNKIQFLESEIIFEVDLSFQARKNITIEFITDGVFEFYGVKTNKNDEIFNLSEKSNLDSLEIGDRLRCTYNSLYSKVGCISLSDRKTLKWIPLHSNFCSDGDFYLIKVNDNLLISDRVIQVYVGLDDVLASLSDSIVGIDGYELSMLSSEEWDTVFSSTKIKDMLGIYYTDNLSGSWVNEELDPTFRGDYLHFGIYSDSESNVKIGEDLMFKYSTVYRDKHAGIGYRPVFKRIPKGTE